MPMTSWSNYLKQVASDVPNSTIAELAGVDVSQVSRWKSGATIPAEKTARQLALGLGLPEDEALAAAGHLKLPVRHARPSPPNSTPSDLPGGLGGYFFTSAKARYLQPILKQARAGTLSLDWREELTPQSVESWGDARLAEIDALAAAEIQSLPYADWEPYRSDWRTALDSWYIASRAALSGQYINEARRLLDQIVDGDRLISTFSRSGRLITSFMETIAPLDDRRDSNRATYNAMYVCDRTKLTVSYLAGFAAAGHDIDWRSWFLSQTKTWPDDQKWQIDLLVNDQHLETLPTYWATQAKNVELVEPATDVVTAGDLLPGDRLIARQKFGTGGDLYRCPEGWIVKTGAHMRDGIECITLDGVDLNLWNGAEYLPQTLFHVQRLDKSGSNTAG